MGVALLLVALGIQPASEPKAFREGVQFLQAGRIQEAEAAFLAVIVATPEDAPSRVQLSRIYMRQDRAADAVRVLEDGLRYRPKGIGLLNELGALLLAGGKAEEAEARFKDAIAVEPRNPRTVMGLARSLAATGHVADGAAVVEKALASESSGAGAGELYFLLGSLRVRLERYRDALDALARARELGIESPGVDVYRAIALASLGQRDEAENTLRLVLERNPDAPEARKQLGLLLVETRPGEALDQLSQTLDAVPDNLQTLETAGLLAVTLNRDEKAIELLSRTRPGSVQHPHVARSR